VTHGIAVPEASIFNASSTHAFRSSGVFTQLNMYRQILSSNATASNPARCPSVIGSSLTFIPSSTGVIVPEPPLVRSP
jgi:hypothetical protein